MKFSICIVVVAYNRLNSLKRLLLSLSEADYDDQDVPLIISIDKSETTDVESYSNEFEWKYGIKSVFAHKNNLGLKKHILSIGEHLNEHNAIIVLEDDLVVSKQFYRYAMETVNKYYSDLNIAGISLYNFSINYQTNMPFEPIRDGYDVFFMQCAMSWGQIWMRHQWLEFINWYKDHESFNYSSSIPSTLFNWGKKSWLKYHTRYCIEKEKYFVFPYVSLTTNTSEVGTNHSSNLRSNPTIHQVALQHGEKQWLLPYLNDDCVKYDGFFENIMLYGVLGVSSTDSCIDLNGLKKNALYKRYWLTLQKADYHVLKSFGLDYHPIEENILRNNQGSDIYLYDTTIREKNSFKRKLNPYLYYFRIRSVVDMTRRLGLRIILSEFFSAICNKLFRYVFKKSH